MNVIAALLGEHGSLYHLLAAIKLAAPRWSAEQLRASGLLLSEAILSHAQIEDDLLFAPLAACGRMPAGPVEAMRAEHQEIEDGLAKLAEVTDAAEGVRLLNRVANTIHHHFGHEEHALFQLGARVLDAATLEELGQQWAKRRGVETSSVAGFDRALSAVGARA
jgi:hemerythrin-like domain-containing protein